MKVAFDHQIFALQRFGGISRYFIELACRLPQHSSSEVVIVAPLHINHYLSERLTRVSTRGFHFPFHFRGLVRLLRVANDFAAPFVWRGVTPDVIHETYFSARPTGSSRRRVATIHDMIYELYPHEFPDFERVTAAKRAAVDRADHVICVSENTRRDLVRLYGTDEAKTSVVHLGCSLPAENEPIAVHTGRPYFLYVGIRRGYKNFQALLHAYAASSVLRRDFDLLTFGGPPFTTGELEQHQELGVFDRVFHRSGGDRELARCYRGASAFVYPSLYEGFGIPPVEAMNYGCPVVCSNAGSIPEVVGDAGLFFDPHRIDELRAALERIAGDTELQAELRARGLVRARSFSWDDCAAATARIYHRIC